MSKKRKDPINHVVIKWMVGTLCSELSSRDAPFSRSDFYEGRRAGEGLYPHPLPLSQKKSILGEGNNAHKIRGITQRFAPKKCFQWISFL